MARITSDRQDHEGPAQVSCLGAAVLKARRDLYVEVTKIRWCLRNPQHRRGASDTRVVFLFGIAGGDLAFFDCDFHVIQGRKSSIRNSLAVMRATVSAYGCFCDERK
jgi:hypothetical protein